MSDVRITGVAEVKWFDCAACKPDCDTTVLVASHDDEPVWLGYWDGERWLSIDNLPLVSEVLYWADLPISPLE